MRPRAHRKSAGKSTDSAGCSQPANRGWGATVGIFLLAILASSALFAKEGRFEIISADARLEDGLWLVDASVDLELSRKVIEALENGVRLHIQLQYEVNRSRSFWMDQNITELTQDIELQYLTLSQRYVVHYLDSDTQTSFASLFSAMRSLRQVRDFPLVDANKLDAENEYWVAMRAVLDQEKLPGPLQILYFWRGDFILDSEWYKWTLR
jgi:hypothetical protein